MNIACPGCGQDLSLSVSAQLPSETDLTISLAVEAGQLVMAKTVAGVIENFAAMQVAIGNEMGADTEVFISGLSMIDNTINITTRIVNAIRVPTQGEQVE